MNEMDRLMEQGEDVARAVVGLPDEVKRALLGVVTGVALAAKIQGAEDQRTA